MAPKSQIQNRITGFLWAIALILSTFAGTQRQHLVMAAELEAIAQRGYLIVGVKDNLRPLGFRDASGNLQGLEIDIARRLAAELLGSPDAVKFQPLANQDRLDAVQSGRIDLAIARVTSTAPRLRVVSFSRPYY